MASILGVIVFFGTLASLFVGYSTFNKLITLKKESLLIATVNRSSKVELVFSWSESLVQSVAGWNEVSELLKIKSDKDLQEAHDHLLSHLHLLNVNDSYSAIYLMDQTGLTLVSTDPRFEGKNYGFREYFQQAMAGHNYVYSSIGVTSHELGFYFSAPVKDENDQIIGVMVVKLKPNVVADVLLQDLSQGISVHLVDRYGIVLISNQDEHVFKAVSKLSAADQEAIVKERRMEGVDIESLDYDQIYQELVDRRYAQDTQVVENQISQQKKISTLTKVNAYPFFIFKEEDVAPIYNSALESSFLIAAIVALTAVVALSLMAIMIYRILSPLKIIQKHVTLITEGNYSHFTKQTHGEIKTGDEFEQFSTILHKMVDTIIDYQNDLKKQIKKTKNKLEDVERLNKVMVGRELKMVEMKKEIKKLKAQKND